MPDAETERLYLSHVREPESALRPSEFAGMRRLEDGLFLLRSDQTRSQVYHAVKWASRPQGCWLRRWPMIRSSRAWRWAR